MIVLPTSPVAHHVGDLVAWLSAFAAGRWQFRRWPRQGTELARVTSTSYFIALALGGVIGAWLFGSLNSLRAIVAAPSHSIAGALAGAIIAVEVWKWRQGITRSTGGAFVLPLCVGLVIGRLGCLFAGLPDFTYGIATTVPWAVDLGDGVSRHPVALYEAISMAIFAGFFLGAKLDGAHWAEEHGFHALILVYAVQRFCWEFLKPYPTVLGPFNLFHLLSLGMIAYALVWWRRGQPAVTG